MADIIYYINIFSLIVSAIMFLGMSEYVRLQNRRAISNQVFSRIAFFASLWAILYIVQMFNRNIDWVVSLFQLPVIASALVVGYSLYFALIYPGERDLARWQKFLLLLVPYS